MKIKIKYDLLPLLSIAGGLLFSLLFWDQAPGLNKLVYSAFILLALLLSRNVPADKVFALYAAIHLFSALMIVVNHSEMAAWAYYISLFAWVGRVHYPLLKTAGTAIVAGIFRFATLPYTLFQRLKRMRIAGISLRPVLRQLKYVLLPAFILLVFTLVYAAANEQFADMLSRLINSILDAISLLEKIISVRMIHILAGMAITAALILNYEPSSFERIESRLTEALIRKERHDRTKSALHAFAEIFSINLSGRKMALKTEFINARICFALLNLLLLFVNVLDMITLFTKGADLNNPSAALHDGTNALIFSIVLAMAVIVFFFRGNLNFLSNNRQLKLLVYVWIVQNAFLVLTVALRDYHYIDLYGLTYKRIGVGAFLILCCAGLFTVYVKVAATRTFFYLYRWNAFFWLIFLTAGSAVNWDVVIAGYNVNRADRISLDVDHLMGLSDKAIAILHTNRDLLKKQVAAISEQDDRTTVPKPGQDSLKQDAGALQLEAAKEFSEQLESKIELFRKRHEKSGWQAWNLPDQRTARYLEHIK
ncbi:DUF4173 domain-containing protein [Pedobacter sp. SYP-B3415]|uniref:DUF4153 domain-containing protein n=1 Tax=Pedobacter sp. SYP-B3415 TaxID=2496641 RepID=UPI00101CB34B|nr:DUF4173 domain-containing protein [Pedobacter sp. SYP-B3415]